MASVAQPAAAASMMSRVDRLDLVLSYLEELHQHHHHRNMSTSSPSTPTTTLSADDSSAASTPRAGSASWRRSCRPAKEVLEEAHAKGSLVDRIAFLEDRVLKMEEGMEITPLESEIERSKRKEKVRNGNKKKKGLKSLVKSCVRKGKLLNTKDY